MSDIICECGHSVDYHRVNGCNHTNDEDIKRWCGCSKQPDTVRRIATIAALTADRDRLAVQNAELKAALSEMVSMLKYGEHYDIRLLYGNGAKLRDEAIVRAAALLKKD